MLDDLYMEDIWLFQRPTANRWKGIARKREKMTMIYLAHQPNTFQYGSVPTDNTM